MICENCKNTAFSEGTLEGVSFKPDSEKKKMLSNAVYGIRAVACIECGKLSNFSINTEALKKILK